MHKIFERYQLIIFDWEGTLAYSENQSDVLYEESLEVIEALTGKKLAIATGKPMADLELALEKFELRSKFNVVCSSSNFPSKPDPTMLLFAIDNTNTCPSDCIMVGDSLVDVLAAKAAGVDSCYINRFGIEHDCPATHEVRRLFYDGD